MDMVFNDGKFTIKIDQDQDKSAERVELVDHVLDVICNIEDMQDVFPLFYIIFKNIGLNILEDEICSIRRYVGAKSHHSDSEGESLGDREVHLCFLRMLERIREEVTGKDRTFFLEKKADETYNKCVSLFSDGMNIKG